MDTESRSGEFVLNKQEHAESAEKPEVVLDNNIEPKPITESTTNRPHFYTSFCQNPEGVMFEEQGENEKILLLIRRDFVTNVPWIVASIIFIFLPFLVVVLFRSLIPQLSLTNAMQITILAFYYLILFGFVLVEFTIWYFNVSFVTNERLVDIDIAGILYKNTITKASA